MGCFCSKQEELVETNNVYILRCEIIFVMIVTSHPFQQNILHEAQEICQGKIEAECICSKCLEHIINLEVLHPVQYKMHFSRNILFVDIRWVRSAWSVHWQRPETRRISLLRSALTAASTPGLPSLTSIPPQHHIISISCAMLPSVMFGLQDTQEGRNVKVRLKCS